MTLRKNKPLPILGVVLFLDRDHGNIQSRWWYGFQKSHSQWERAMRITNRGSKINAGENRENKWWEYAQDMATHFLWAVGTIKRWMEYGSFHRCHWPGACRFHVFSCWDDQKMRIVNTFLYNGAKSFRAGELTVAQYYAFLRDPESAIETVLGEYNTKLPELNQKQLSRFLDILLWNDDPLGTILKKKRNKAKDEETMRHHELDFHISYVAVCKQINGDCWHLPLVVFKRIVDDIKILTGQQEYDPKRHVKTPDKKGFAELQGQGVLHNKKK